MVYARGTFVAKRLAFLRKRDILAPASHYSPSPAEPHGGGLTTPFCGGVQAGALSGLHHAAPCRKVASLVSPYPHP